MSFTLEVTLAKQTEHMSPVYVCVSLTAVKADFCFTFSSQLDADRDEEEVFCDISMTLDNKLFPSKEPAAGEMITAFYKTLELLFFVVVQRGLITVQQDIYCLYIHLITSVTSCLADLDQKCMENEFLGNGSVPELPSATSICQIRNLKNKCISGLY